MPGPPPLCSRALLFDLDGVLADSTASVEAHWRQWAARHALDADALLTAAARLGRRPVECVVVEDAPVGVAAARAAGMACVALTTTHRATEVADAALVVPSLAGLRVEISPQRDGGVAYTLAAADGSGPPAA